MSRRNGGIIGPTNTPVGGIVVGSASGVWRMNDVLTFVSNNQWPSGPQNIDNSCRFDDGSSDSLTRTSGTPTNSDICTFSVWFKLGADVTANDIFIFGEYTDVNNYFGLSKKDNGRLQFFQYDGGSLIFNVQPNRLFRDHSAFYHVVVAYDSSQSTSSNRVKMYINGEQVTSFNASTYPSQNADIRFNTNNQSIKIGQQNSNLYWDGYMAEVVFIDGQALDPTSFGETDSTTGIWKPKKIGAIANAGSNSFYLNFKDSSNLGKDESGLGNNFTVNNLTSIDQTTDTCVENFATLNPLVTLSGGTLSEGNLKYNYGSNGWRSSFSSIGANKGKWYCEAKFDSGTHLIVGIVDEDGYSRNSGNFLADSTFNYSNGYAYYSNDGTKNATGKDGQATSASYGNSFSAGDIIGIAMDLDNGKLYFSKNGTFQDSGDPTSGSTGTGSAYNITNSTTSNYFFGVSPYNATVSLNLGSPSFSISSGNSDANGFGNFEYSVPSGYYALNTSNLNTYG